MTNESNLYIEFQVSDPNRFEALQNIFQQFKADKENEHERDVQEWFALFDHQARSHFWWPTEQEAQAHFAKPESEQPDVGWGFQDMIDAIYSAEYTLISCEYLNPSLGKKKYNKQNVARLEFREWSYPYGSCDALKALVEAFECRVIHFDCGYGYSG